MNISNPFSGVLDLYQDNDFNAQGLYSLGFRLAIHKAGQWALPNRDKNTQTYRDRKQAWQNSGGLWGSYFLPLNGYTAKDLFAQWQACDNDPNIMRAIDWEDGGNGAASQDTVRDLAILVGNTYGSVPVIYGSNTLTEMTPDVVLGGCPLWYANPKDGGKIPIVFAPNHPPQGRVVFWQFTQDSDPITKHFDGADVDAFNGTADQLQAAYPFFKDGGGAPAPAPLV